MPVFVGDQKTNATHFFYSSLPISVFLHRAPTMYILVGNGAARVLLPQRRRGRRSQAPDAVHDESTRVRADATGLLILFFQQQ